MKIFNLKKKKIFISLILLNLLWLKISAQQIVRNPDKPYMKNSGRIIPLKEEMRITDKQGEFYFQNPYNIKVALDGSIFVLGNEQFLKFNPDGKFIKDFFKKGQGPGEFLRIENFLFHDNEIIINQSRPSKIVKMDMNGNFIREFKPEKMVTKLVAYFGNKYIMLHYTFPKFYEQAQKGLIDVIWNLLMISEDGKIEETGLSFPVQWFGKRIRGAFIADSITDFIYTIYNDKYIVVSHTQNYLLKVINLERKKIVRIFDRKYKRVKYIPEKETKKGRFRRLKVPRDYYNDILRIFTYKNNIWVFTSTKDQKKGLLVDVFNVEGKYIDNFYLPLPENIKLKDLSKYPICIYKDYLFTVEYDENDIPFIVKYKIKYF